MGESPAIHLVNVSGFYQSFNKNDTSGNSDNISGNIDTNKWYGATYLWRETFKRSVHET